VTLVDPLGNGLTHRRRGLLPLPSDDESAPSTAEAEYVAAFARFLSRNVAAGDPAEETRATYAVHVATWLAWCRGVDLDVSAATIGDVEDFREALVGAGCLPNTIAIKLTLVRRLYDAAVRAGMRRDNPAVGVRTPRSKRAAEDFGYLGEGELALLLRAVTERTSNGQPRALCDFKPCTDERVSSGAAV
jgi:site-specific recombinase XerD